MTETCSAILRSRRNCSSDSAERTDDGRAFHARAAVTGKARSPRVVRRVVGMTSVDVEALGRRWREPTLAVRWRVSARYDGAVPIRQRYARTHNRNWILSGTFSQCSSLRSVNWKLRATPSFCKPTACHTVLTPRASAGFWLGGQCPLAAWGEENFENLATKWCMHSEVYLNKYVVSIAPFSTPAFTPRLHSENLSFCMFSLFNFSSIFQGGQLTPFAPMCGRPCLPHSRRSLSNLACERLAISASYTIEFCDGQNFHLFGCCAPPPHRWGKCVERRARWYSDFTSLTVWRQKCVMCC